jgi:hypothetical protein
MAFLYLLEIANFIVLYPSVNAGIPVICIPDIKKPDMNHQMKAAAVFDSLYDVIGFFQARDNEI